MIQMAPQNMTLWVQFSFSKTWIGVSSNPRLHQYIDSCIFCINVTFRCPFFVQIIELTFCNVYKRPIISSFCVTSDLCSWIRGIFEMFSQNNTSNITGQSAAACCFFPLLQLLLQKKKLVYLQIIAVFDSLQHDQSNICTLSTREHGSLMASTEIWEG